jgi:hypothetical protein
VSKRNRRLILTNEQWFDCFGQDKKHESKALEISEKNRKDLGKPKSSRNRKIFVMG